MSPIYVERGKVGLEITPAEEKSRKEFEFVKKTDILKEDIYESVNKMLRKVREVSPDSGIHSGKKREEYWYGISDLRFVIANLMNTEGSVIRTTYSPIAERRRSGNSKAVAMGIITADGLFYTIRPGSEEHKFKLDITAYDNSGLKYPIEYGLENDPEVIDNEDVLYMGKSGKCDLGKIFFSFIDPMYGDFSSSKGKFEDKVSVQEHILASLRSQIEAAENI